MRFSMPSLLTPGAQMPATSPLTSHRNTSTPASEKLSAITFIVMVLPVPLAPAIRPWRLHILSASSTRAPSASPMYILPFSYIVPSSVV